MAFLICQVPMKSQEHESNLVRLLQKQHGLHARLIKIRHSGFETPEQQEPTMHLFECLTVEGAPAALSGCISTLLEHSRTAVTGMSVKDLLEVCSIELIAKFEAHNIMTGGDLLAHEPEQLRSSLGLSREEMLKTQEQLARYNMAAAPPGCPPNARLMANVPIWCGNGTDVVEVVTGFMRSANTAGLAFTGWEPFITELKAEQPLMVKLCTFSGGLHELRQFLPRYLAFAPRQVSPAGIDQLFKGPMVKELRASGYTTMEQVLALTRSEFVVTIAGDEELANSFEYHLNDLGLAFAG